MQPSGICTSGGHDVSVYSVFRERQTAVRILAIEDDHRVASFLQRGLGAEGFQTSVSHDGAEGLEKVTREDYDVLLLDVALPGLSGVEICRHLRERGVDIPILMLTAKDSVADRIKGFEAGADDYLTKPFAFEELIARIKAVLRRGENTNPAPMCRVGDLMLDRAAYEVRRNGRLIPLTPTEFVLLEYLMRSANRAVSRARIEEHVWCHDSSSPTNVLEVYIRRLRKKIDQGFTPRLIHTVRGIGYQLKEPE